MSAGFLGLLPVLLGWLACFWLVHEIAARKHLHPDWRLAWLGACVAWGTLLTFVVEIASQFHALNAPTLLAGWIFLSALLGGIAARLTLQRRKFSAVKCKEFLARCKLSAHAQPPLDIKLMTWFSGLLILLLGFVAGALPDTSWDSLTTHLPRVMQWIQQGSVEHFPTNNANQIQSAPWTAFAVTTLHLLQGSDQCANLIQWFALLMSVVGATFIAQQLLAWISSVETPVGDADRVDRNIRTRVSAFAALLVMTLPIGAVEALTAQIDYVATAWLVCLTSFALMLAREPGNLSCAVAVSLAFALTWLTNTAMCLCALPAVLLLVVWWFVKLNSNPARWRFALILVLGFALLNAGHFTRNFRCFGSPFGSAQILAHERNEHFSVGGTFSNVIRNLLLQTNTGVVPLTKVINTFSEKLHRVTGRELNAPDTTSADAPFAFRDQFIVTDSYASSPVHLLLVAMAAAFLIMRSRRHNKLLVFGGLIFVSFLLFCAMFRWQQGNGRILLAHFVLLTPLVAVVFVTHAPRGLVSFASLCAAGFVAFALVQNRSRPLLDLKLAALPRERQCLQPLAAHLYEPFAQICDDLAASRCQRVGLKLNSDDAEYPLWLMLRQRGFRGRIEHVRVANESRRIAAHADLPDAVISIAAPQSPPFTKDFPYQTDFGLFTVFWSEPFSRWEQLTYFDHGQAQSRLVTVTDQRFLFSHRLLTFYHRAARAGSLKLTGNITDVTGAAVRHNSLRVTTNDGEATLSLDGHPITIELSLPPPESVIKLAVLEPVETSDGVLQLRDFHWNWQPDSAKAVTKVETAPSRAAQ